MIHQSEFNLTHVELFLKGDITVAALAARPYKAIDRVLAAYAIAIAAPRGVQYAQRAAVLPPGSEDWLLHGPISHLFSEVFAGQVLPVKSMTQLSLDMGLHYGATKSGAMLVLPRGLVELAKRHENHAVGPISAFYQERMKRNRG